MFVVRQLHFEQIYRNVVTAVPTAHALTDKTHLSLVTVTWLIKISCVAMTVAYFFLICNRAGREGGREENYWLLGRRGGTDPTHVFSLPFTASYISLYSCPLVMPVQL